MSARLKREFWGLLTEAVQDLAEHGYDDPKRLQDWSIRLRDAAQWNIGSDAQMTKKLRENLKALYRRTVKSGLKRRHPGIPLFTIERIEPQLREALDRRILASADLIKINKEQAVEKTLQRFAGWATSIPPGGSKVVDKRAVKSHVAKSLQQMDFEERRLYIDQGHKLIENISAIVAEQSGAIAAKWRHVHQAGYDGRPEHEARDGQWFVLRDSWAVKEGLVKRGNYSDTIDQPAEAPFCRCWWEYATSLSDLPPDLLTIKGQKHK